MKIEDYEKLINQSISNVIDTIINKNLILNISAKSRAGAEISNFIEDEFVKEVNNNSYEYLKSATSSPKGATKNPWDAKLIFKYKDNEEEIWIDFKAFKLSQQGSNPDIGTPNKIIKFIKTGNFYLLYIYVFYDENDNGLKFEKVNNSYIKSYFLKDVNHTFRRNPKNQLQISLLADPEYRSREEFIKLFFKKIKESYKREIKKSYDGLISISNSEIEILEINKKQEIHLIKILNN